MSMVGAVELLLQVRDEITPVLEDVNRSVEETGAQLETLAQKVTYAFGQATKAVGDAASESEASMKRWAAGITGATLAFDAMEVSVAKMATNVNAQLANTTALLTDFTDDQIPGLVDTMRSGSQEMSVTFGKSTADMTAGLYDVVSSLGYTSDSLKQLEISAKAGAAGVATTQQAFLGLSAITKAYGDTSQEAFTKAADIMFETVNRGVVTFPQLSAVIGQVGTYAAKLNVPLTEVGAVIATLSGVTGTASEVTTQMVSAMTALINPTDQLQKMYTKWGYASGTAAVSAMGLTGTLQRLTKEVGTDEQALVKLLRRKEAYILTTALAGKQATDFAQKMNFMTKAANSNGETLNRAFERQTQGVNAVGFAWEQFKQKSSVALEKLGQIALVALEPIVTILNKIMDAGAAFVDMLSKWPKTVAFIASGFEVLARIIAVILFLLGSLAGIAGAAISALGGVITAIAVWGLYRVALTFVIGLLTQYISAVLSAGAATATWGLVTGQSVNFVALAWKSLLAPIESVKMAYSGLQTMMTGAGIAAWGTAALAAGVAGAVLGRSLLEAGDAARGLNDPVREGIKNVGLLEGAWELFKAALGGTGSVLSDIGSTIVDVIGNKAINVIKALIESVTGARVAFTLLAPVVSEVGDKIFQMGAYFTDLKQKQKEALGDPSGVDAWKKKVDEANAAGAKLRAENEKLAKISGYLSDVQTQQVASTDAVIRKTIEDLKNTATLEKWKKKLGDETLTLATALRYQAIETELNNKKMSEAEKASKRLVEETKRLIQTYKEQNTEAGRSAEVQKQLSIILAGMGPIAKASAVDIGLAAEAMRKLGVEGEVAAKNLEAAAMAAGSLPTLPIAKISPDFLKNVPKPPGADALAKQEVLNAQAAYEAQEKLNKKVAEHAYALLKAGVISREVFEQMTAGIKKVEVEIEKAETATEKWARRFSELAAVQDAVYNVLNQVAALPEAFARATDQASGFFRTLATSQIGASLGGGIGDLVGKIFKNVAQFAGPIGQIAGGLIGGIVGFFKKPKWVQIGKDAGKILGFAVSEELAKAIEATMKDLNVDLQTATLLNLDRAIEESGKAASSFLPQVMQLFSGIAKGTIPAVEGVYQIGNAFALMVEEVEAGSGLASDAMRSIIATTIATGIKVQEVSDYIGSLADEAAPALQARFAALSPETENLGEKMERLGRITFATFQALLFAGDNVIDIFETLGPAIDEAFALAEEAGIELTGRLRELDAWRGLILANQELVDSVASTPALLKLAAAGFGDLADMVALVTEDYEDLIAAGFSNAQALAMQAPSLKMLNELYKRGLIPTLDAATLKHIEEAEAMGLLDPTPQEAMVEATEQLVVLMGMLVQSMGIALPAAIQAAIDKWNQLNTVAGNTPLGTGEPEGPPGPDNKPPGFQAGFFSPELPKNALVQLHAGERVEVTPAGSPTRARNAQDAGGIGFILQPGAIQINGVADPRQAAEETIRLLERRLMPRLDTALGRSRR